MGLSSIDNDVEQGDGSTGIARILLHEKDIRRHLFRLQTFRFILLKLLLNGSLLVEKQDAKCWLGNHLQRPLFGGKHLCKCKSLCLQAHLADELVNHFGIRLQRHPVIVLILPLSLHRYANIMKELLNSLLECIYSNSCFEQDKRWSGCYMGVFMAMQNSDGIIIIFLKLEEVMQVKSIQRTNTLTSLNKKASSKVIGKTAASKGQDKQNDHNVQKSIFHTHPAFRFLRGTSPTHLEYKKFVTLLYKGLFYSINNLKGPSQEYINKKKVKLAQPLDSKKKFLVLDLDQTLIHSVFTNDKTDVKFTCKGDQFKFNVRPYCFEFLANMANYYNVYVFTAGTHDYAEPIITYLNQKKKTILGFLHRKNCMETQNGFFIKDLRIIENRDLKDIIMVDNLAHSFGLQVSNGVPILEFLNNPQDKELQGIEKMLIEASEVHDVRDYLEDKLALRKVLQIEENDFLEIEQDSKKM